MNRAAALSVILLLISGCSCSDKSESIILFSGETLRGSEYGLCKAAWKPEKYGQLLWGRPNDTSLGSPWGVATQVLYLNRQNTITYPRAYKVVAAEIAFGEDENGLWDKSFIVIEEQ